MTKTFTWEFLNNLFGYRKHEFYDNLTDEPIKIQGQLCYHIATGIGNYSWTFICIGNVKP